MEFKDLNLSKPLLDTIERVGFKQPTKVQQETIGKVLDGQDLLVCAQTGTGKTAAYAIPILEHLMKKHETNLSALILAPTRELAIQIFNHMEQLAANTGCKAGLAYGGVGQGAQIRAIESNISILVATPGRLVDLILREKLNLNTIKILVLDEADQMLLMGFEDDIQRILGLLPKQRQNLLFSATLPDKINTLTSELSHEFETIHVDHETAEIEQCVYYVDRENKVYLLAHLIKERAMKSVIVFTRTKHGADQVVERLTKAKVRAAAIHGEKSQGEREEALRDFVEGRIKVLVATDVAARGIDIPDLAFVVNYDIPNQTEVYTHRIGRTGRGGTHGTAISFCNINDMEYMKNIQKELGITIPEVTSRWPMKDFVKMVRPHRRGTNSKTRRSN